MNTVVNNVANDYSIERVDLTAGGCTIHGKNIVVAMPTCNAEKALRQTLDELPHDLVDEVVLVDDASSDSTIEVAQKLGINATIRQIPVGESDEHRLAFRTDADTEGAGAGLTLDTRGDKENTR